MFHKLIYAIFNLAADRDPCRRAHCGLEGFRQRGEVETFGNWNDGYVVRYAVFFSLLSFRGISCSTLHFALHFYFVGLGKSNAVGPTMVGHLATAFLDALYKA